MELTEDQRGVTRVTCTCTLYMLMCGCIQVGGARVGEARDWWVWLGWVGLEAGRYRVRMGVARGWSQSRWV